MTSAVLCTCSPLSRLPFEPPSPGGSAPAASIGCPLFSCCFLPSLCDLSRLLSVLLSPGGAEREWPAAGPDRGQEGGSDSEAGQPQKGETVISSPSLSNGLFGGNAILLHLFRMAWSSEWLLTSAPSRQLALLPASPPPPACRQRNRHCSGPQA